LERKEKKLIYFDFQFISLRYFCF